jgi:D-arabinose 1-dehydrogenase-like Zn-dependent alcohol dehydrogenase
VFVAPGRYGVQESPRPSLAEGALLLHVEMSGICGTDKHTFLGETNSTPARQLRPTHLS